MKKKFFCIVNYVFLGLFAFSQISTRDAYVFPIKQGTEEWAQFETIEARITSLQIPDAVLERISTEGLLETCLNYPYLTNIFFRDSYQQGLEALMAEFNGFRELFKRQDLPEAMLNKYRRQSVEMQNKNIRLQSEIEQGRLTFRHFVLEFMLTQNAILNKLSSEQEEQLVLLGIEHIKIRQKYSDIFGALNSSPLHLPFAQRIMSDLEFITENFIQRNLTLPPLPDEPPVFGQVLNVKTPRGTEVQDVEVLLSPDFQLSEPLLNLIRADLYHNYDGATMAGNPSLAYNCHGYAWHKFDGGGAVQIGRNEPAAHFVYWDDRDRSYVAVPESIATKVTYQGNHSAVREENSEWYVSKWGYGGPLVRHRPNAVLSDYQPSYPKTYYVRAPIIIGSSPICTPVTYSADRWISGSRWEVIGNNLQINGADNNISVLISRVGNSSGTGEVRIMYNDVILAWRNVTVGCPQPVLTGPDFICTSATFSITNFPVGATVVWTASPGLSVLGNGSSAVVSRVADSHFNAWVRATVSVPGSSPIVLQRTVPIVWRTGIQNPSAVTVTGSPTLFGGEFSIGYEISTPTLVGSNFWWTTNVTWQAVHQGAFFVWLFGSEAQHYPIEVTVTFTDVCGGFSVVYKQFWDYLLSPVNIYPNPASDVINIKITQQAINRVKAQQGIILEPRFDIQLFDSRGNLVRQTTSSGDVVQLNVSNLQAGVYSLQVFDGVSCAPEVQQVIIRR